MLTAAAAALVVATAFASDVPSSVPADANVHAVDAGGDVAVTVSFGKAHSVAVTGKVNVRMDGDKLVVDAAVRAEGARPTVTIVVDALSSVKASGRARVDVSGVNGKPIAVFADNGASVSLSGKTAALTLSAAGTSRVDASALSAQAVDAKLNEAARADVTATASLTCDLQRASRLTVKGKPKAVTKNVVGVAKLTID